jgi:hypothetical protein
LFVVKRSFETAQGHLQPAMSCWAGFRIKREHCKQSVHQAADEETFASDCSFWPPNTKLCPLVESNLLALQESYSKTQPNDDRIKEWLFDERRPKSDTWLNIKKSVYRGMSIFCQAQDEIPIQIDNYHWIQRCASYDTAYSFD